MLMGWKAPALEIKPQGDQMAAEWRAGARGGHCQELRFNPTPREEIEGVRQTCLKCDTASY